MIKVGLLLPNATNYPYLTNHFASGLRLAFEKNKIEHQLFFESTGNGAAAKDILEKAQKLFIQSGVHILLVYGNNRVAKALINLAEANRKMLYFTNLGTSTLPDIDSKYFMYNTFGMWDSAYLLGLHWGKRKSKIFVASGFHEAGYNFSHAFELGLTTGGGEVIGYKIERDTWNNSSIVDLIEKAEEADAIFATISEPDVGNFMKHYAEEKPNKTLIGGALTHLANPSREMELSIEGFTSWDIDLDTTNNKTFVSDYRMENAEAPSLFSQMGHEAGVVIAKQHDLGAFDSRSGFVTEGFEVNSSRGQLSYFEGTASIRTPQYKYKIQFNSTTERELELTEELTEGEMGLSQLNKLEDQNDSGWLNPYPCN